MKNKRTAVLNKTAAIGDPPKMFEPLLIARIPGKELATEGCGTNAARHVNRDFSGARPTGRKISESEPIIHAANIPLPSKVA